MSGRNVTLALVGVALLLAGLGHYYVLYKDDFVRDAVVFYAAALVLLGWVYGRVVAAKERRVALLWSALDRLFAVLRNLFLRTPARPLVGLLIVLNVVAGLLAFLAPVEASWRATALVALLWAGGVLALLLLVLESLGVRWPSLPARRPAGEHVIGEEPEAGKEPGWVRQLREQIGARGRPIGRILLAIGLVFALLGQYTFFFRRDSGHADRDGGILWVVAIVTFGLLAGVEAVTQGAEADDAGDDDDGGDPPPEAGGTGGGGGDLGAGLSPGATGGSGERANCSSAGETKGLFFSLKPTFVRLRERTGRLGRRLRVAGRGGGAVVVARPMRLSRLRLCIGLAGVPFAIAAQVFLTYGENVWVGAIGHLLGVGLFVGSMVRWRAGWRLFHVSRLAERLRGLSWGLLLVVIGLALVLLGAYAALVPPVYARNYRLAILLWAAGVVTGVVGVIRPGHRGRRRRIRRGEWREAAWVGLLVLVGLALRMVALDRFPDVMSGDEGSFALEAGRIMQGVYLNPFGSAWFGNATWWFYLQAAAMQVMGWNLFALRFVSPFFGAFSVAAVYVLARATFGRETAWVSALFMAGWGFSVHMSRLGFSNCGDLLLPGLVMAFLQRGLTHGRRVHFVAAGLALGVAFYFYLGSRLTVPIMVATLFFAGKERLRMRWRGLLFLAVVALLVSGPLLAYFVRHPDAFLARHRVLDLILSGRLAAAQESTGKAGSLILLENLGPAATVFISTLDLGYFYRPASPMLYVLSGALFVLGLGLALFGWRQVRYKATLAWIVLTVLFAGMFLKPPPHYDRYEIVAPAVCLLVGRAGVVVVRRLARLAGWGRRARRVMVLALGVVLLAVNVAFYVGVYVPAGAFHWDRNTVIADRTARLMAGLGPDYETYFLGTRFMPLSGFNSVYVLAPEAEWEEFLDPPMEDWDLVNDERGMIFVVLPSRVDELAVLQERFPGGVTWEETARDDSVLFTVYRVDPTGN